MARLDEYQGYIEDILSEYQQCTPAYGEAESDILYFQSELLVIAPVSCHHEPHSL